MSNVKLNRLLRRSSFSYEVRAKSECQK